MNQECPHNKACIQEKCQNPCTKSCGLNAKCDVVNHTPFCTCEQGYEGDAFISCTKIPPSKCKMSTQTFKFVLIYKTCVLLYILNNINNIFIQHNKLNL